MSHLRSRSVKGYAQNDPYMNESLTMDEPDDPYSPPLTESRFPTFYGKDRPLAEPDRALSPASTQYQEPQDSIATGMFEWRSLTGHESPTDYYEMDRVDSFQSARADPLVATPSLPGSPHTVPIDLPRSQPKAWSHRKPPHTPLPDESTDHISMDLTPSQTQTWEDHKPFSHMLPDESTDHISMEPYASLENARMFPWRRPTRRQPVDGAGTSPYAAASGAKASRKKTLWCWLLAALLVLAALGLALGVGLGVGLGHKSKDSFDASAPAPALAELPKWDWLSPTKKVFGVNVGGWLVLERWMYEDWMVQVGGPNAWDEYRMSQQLGDRIADVLNAHMDSWFTESDLDRIQSYGMNMLRVPIGYWSFLSTRVTGEPYRNATQLDHLSNLMHWAWKRGLYILLDLHAMPGSQNNDQSSGRNDTRSSASEYVRFYSDANQDYSRQVVTAAIEWVAHHPAKSVIAGFTSVNEPRVYHNRQYLQKLRDFYDFSLEKLKILDIPLVAHHAFVDKPYQAWRSYAQAKGRSHFILDDHPYPAWFQNPLPDKIQSIVQSVCQYTEDMRDFPTPVLMGEYSPVSILNDSTVTTDLLRTELKVFGRSAGSLFFTYRINASTHPLAGEAEPIALKYSMYDMTLPNNPVAQFPRFDNYTPVVNWTNQLTNSCP
ncbi:hypothetical protein MNAN1_002820 [Malassezia nana]|uniref:glucan 1,3-beta-glucosidase n=1 Tax=Malassezia nana TaxID=180528 RepID=A0AAF0ENP0_9BASI|nr:hypothetical protein MNAN1_002820 [Malassezia nana]